MVEVAQHMIRICRLRKLRLMAWITVCVDKLIVVVDVTRLTLCAEVPSCQCKARCYVVKRRGSPRRCCVALHAVRAEIQLRMVRISGTVEICPMTVNAIRWRVCVLIVLMALSARHSLMRACERKARRAMIERRRTPCRLCMACQALRREIACNVIRVRSSIEIILMAWHAVRWFARIHVIAVTVSALPRLMRSDEWKPGLIVVVARSLPHSCRMACLTVGGESRRCMVRANGCCIVRLMTGNALRRG